MASASSIEWTDSTFNGWIGCTRVSPACDNCYAAVSTPARRGGIQWGAGKPRTRTGEAYWRQPLRWNATPYYECGCGYRGTMGELTTNAVHGCDLQFKLTRRRVFCSSLSDWLDNEVEINWLADLLSLIASTPNLDWLLLTKRIGNWRSRLTQAVGLFESRLAAGRGDNAGYAMTRNWLLGEAPANVWVGDTICDQAEADRDITKLLSVPATVRYLSIEPTLSGIDIRWALSHPIEIAAGFLQRGHFSPGLETLRRLDWVIAGGESGPHARPSHPDWFRWLRDQCHIAGVPFLFKQWGEWHPSFAHEVCGSRHHLAIHRMGTVEYRPAEALWTSQEQGWAGMCKVGKKAAGRLLDGVVHNAFPITAGAHR